MDLKKYLNVNSRTYYLYPDNQVTIKPFDKNEPINEIFDEELIKMINAPIDYLYCFPKLLNWTLYASHSGRWIPDKESKWYNEIDEPKKDSWFNLSIKGDSTFGYIDELVIYKTKKYVITINNIFTLNEN